MTTPKEIEEHAAHGRRYFGGADCTCPICVKHRQDQLPSSICPACHGTKKILEDHDGRAGYRPCKECT